MLDLEFLEKIHIFIPKCLLGMMLLLIQNIVVYILDLRMTVRESTVACLPTKFSFDPCMVIDEIGRIILDIPRQVRYRHYRLEADKNVRMIRNAVDNDRFMSLVLDDPRHIFENFIPPFFLKEVLTSLHSKDDLNINLRKCSSPVYLG